MAALVVFVGLVGLSATPARADIWCLHEAGSSAGGACVFPSAGDCAMAARLNPVGGVCERQPLGLREEADDRRRSERRSPRRKDVDRW